MPPAEGGGMEINMRKTGLFIMGVLMSCCLCACSSDDKKNEQTTASNTDNVFTEEGSDIESDDSGSDDGKSVAGEAETNSDNVYMDEVNKPIPKVEILGIATSEEFDWYMPEDNEKREKTEGYIVAFSNEEMLIEEGEWRTDNPGIAGYWINILGERLLELAEDVQVWGLFGVDKFVQIPLEDIDNYEAMQGWRGYWNILLNEEGKVDFIYQAYIP